MRVPLLAACCLSLWLTACRRPAPLADTAVRIDPERYYAVQLSTGAVFFGKLEAFGTPYPVLTGVFYVQTATDPKTKTPSSVLVKRGGEWHEPDRMYLNEKAIVLVEPVGPDSKVARLIAGAKP